MIISPIVADCIRCFNSEGAISNNLHDNVLCPKDYQVISSNSRFLKGLSYRPRVIYRQGASPGEGDRDCGALACAKSVSLRQPEEDFYFHWIVDALLGDLAGIEGDLIAGLLVWVGVSDLGGNVIGSDERGWMSANQVHPVDPKEVDQDGGVRNDN
jgi:hypothetical protein